MVHSRVSRDREESVRWARPSFPTLAPPRRLGGGWAAGGRAAARCCRAALAEAATAVGTADSRAWLAAWRHKVAAVGARGSGGHPCDAEVRLREHFSGRPNRTKMHVGKVES